MDELRQLMAFGKELGYTGTDLQKYIDRETDRIETKRKSDLEREERMKERERTREKEREIFEKEKQEKELEMLKVQADIAEKSSKTPPATGKLGVSSLKMPAFEEHRDQLDAYLERFERFATGEKWNKIDWAIRLSALLKGKALDVFSRLPEEEALDYDKLKVALLKNYQMTEDGYRVRFRTCRPEKLETPSQFAARISSYLHNWIKMTHINKTYEDLIDLLLREQFINACSKEMTMYLKERKCSNINSMCELAEQYVEAHGQHSFASYFSKNVSASNTFSKSNLKNNSSSEKTNTGKPKQLIQSSNSSPSFKCYNCGRQGHKASQCKEPKKQRSSISVHGMLALEQHKAITEAVKEGVKEALLSTSKSEGNACLLDECKQQHEPLNVLNLSCEASAGEPRSHPLGMPTCKGIVSNTVVSVLRDTGCSTAVVRSELVDPEELTGETRTCVLIDGTEKKFPLAVVYVDSPFYKGQVEALCIDNPVYDLIIGNVKGARQPQDPDPNWLPGELKSDANIVSAVETRAAAKKKGKPLKPLHVSSPIQDVNYDEFVKAQHEDPSLSSLWGKVSEQQDGKYKYIVKNKVLVRQYQSRDRKDTYHSRVVVPVKYRNEVCRIAHESILSGHQGKARTYDKVASQFYWPGIHDTVGKFVASCDICQKTLAKGKVGKVPLGKMPLIEEPFKRVAMDLVGPIYPASDRGKRFILTIMDYATRYPEAVALSNIDTETVAEALLQVYSRVGIPSEILTDMGTQFTSAVMREVSRLLTIKQLNSSPYNPRCNGMIERFNGNLKTMLKRMCAEQPRQWDRYLAPLLFVYREAPHESLGGFSPFELLFGRRVRGPMHVLKELLTKEDTETEIKTTYQYVIDLKERLHDTCTMAHEMLEKASKKYKEYYDRKTKPRSLDVGDQVLILLPTDNNKLLLQWKGPYTVMQKFNDVDYKVNVNEKVKTYHINLLKKYIPRKSLNLIGSCLFDACFSEENVTDYSDVVLAIETELNSSNSDMTINDGMYIEPMPSVKRKQGPEHIKIDEKLSEEQKAQLGELTQKYESVFTDVPRKTNVIECDLQLTSSQPVRSKPYPVPHALRDVINKEVSDMLSLGIIEKSDSPYASPVVLVRKKDGTVRFCVDFRKLNQVILFDPEPIPNPEDLFSKLTTGKFFSKIDLTKGYWQIPMSERSKNVTSFVTPEGEYRFLYMPFGLVVAPAVFTRMMRELFGNIPNVVSFIDDICCYNSTWTEHLKTLEQVFQILQQANLAAKPVKCELGFSDLGFLGHRVGHGKLQTNQELLDKIQNCDKPKTKKEVRSFLGLVGFYRRFIPNFAEIAVPLTDLTKKGQGNKVKWENAQEKSFQTLKALLVKPPILQLPDFSKVFVLRTDASDRGMCAILMQDSEGLLHPVAYASRKLLPREQNYSVIEREALAIIWAISKFEVYLFGRPFVIQTDHKPLMYINKTKCVNKRVMRWAILLQEYKFSIEAIPGKANHGPDFLSRVPVL